MVVKLRVLDRERTLKDLSSKVIITTLMTLTDRTNFDYSTDTNEKLIKLIKNESELTRLVCEDLLGSQRVYQALQDELELAQQQPAAEPSSKKYLAVFPPSDHASWDRKRPKPFQLLTRFGGYIRSGSPTAPTDLPASGKVEVRIVCHKADSDHALANVRSVLEKASANPKINVGILAYSSQKFYYNQGETHEAVLSRWRERDLQTIDRSIKIKCHVEEDAYLLHGTSIATRERGELLLHSYFDEMVHHLLKKNDATEHSKLADTQKRANLFKSKMRELRPFLTSNRADWPATTEDTRTCSNFVSSLSRDQLDDLASFYTLFEDYRVWASQESATNWGNLLGVPKGFEQKKEFGDLSDRQVLWLRAYNFGRGRDLELFDADAKTALGTTEGRIEALWRAYNAISNDIMPTIDLTWLRINKKANGYMTYYTFDMWGFFSASRPRSAASLPKAAGSDGQGLRAAATEMFEGDYAIDPVRAEELATNINSGFVPLYVKVRSGRAKMVIGLSKRVSKYDQTPALPGPAPPSARKRMAPAPAPAPPADPPIILLNGSDKQFAATVCTPAKVATMLFTPKTAVQSELRAKGEEVCKMDLDTFVSEYNEMVKPKKSRSKKKGSDELLLTRTDLSPLLSATDKVSFYLTQLPDSRVACVAQCRKKLMRAYRFLHSLAGGGPKRQVARHRLERQLTVLTASIKHNRLEHEARRAKFRNLIHGHREQALSRSINMSTRAELGLEQPAPAAKSAAPTKVKPGPSTKAAVSTKAKPVTAVARPPETPNQIAVYHRLRREALATAAAQPDKYKVPGKIYSTEKGTKVDNYTTRLPFTRSAVNEEATERRKRQLQDSSAAAIQRFVKEVAPGAPEVTFRPPEGAFTGSKHLPLPKHLRGISESFSRPRRRLGLTRSGDRLLFKVKTTKAVTNTYAVPTLIIPNDATLKINDTSVTKFIVQTIKIGSDDDDKLELKTATKVVLTPHQVSEINPKSASGASTLSSSWVSVTSVGDLPAVGLAGISRAAGVKPKNDEKV